MEQQRPEERRAAAKAEAREQRFWQHACAAEVDARTHSSAAGDKDRDKDRDRDRDRDKDAHKSNNKPAHEHSELASGKPARRRRESE